MRPRFLYSPVRAPMMDMRRIDSPRERSKQSRPGQQSRRARVGPKKIPSRALRDPLRGRDQWLWQQLIQPLQVSDGRQPLNCECRLPGAGPAPVTMRAQPRAGNCLEDSRVASEVDRHLCSRPAVRRGARRRLHIGPFDRRPPDSIQRRDGDDSVWRGNGHVQSGEPAIRALRSRRRRAAALRYRGGHSESGPLRLAGRERHGYRHPGRFV